MISKTFTLLCAGSIFLCSCVSTTVIQSIPSGAKVYLNDEFAGTTPYLHSDTKIVGSTTTVTLEKEGYEPFDSFFTRNEEVDVGAVVGGVLVYVPFLWTMKYKPARTYELIPYADYQDPLEQAQTPENYVQVKSKAIRLRELKGLLNDEIITQEEYDKEKKKILEEDEK